MSAPATSTSGEALGRLSRDDIPFLFDALTLGADGTIVHTAREKLRFSFDYQGITFNAEGSRSGAGRLLGLSRHQIRNRLKKFGVEDEY